MDFYDPNDDAFDPSTYGSQQRSYLPRARKQSAGGALSQKSADAAFERFMELAGGKDDYSEAQMQALERSKQANMDDRLAIAAQYAGPKFAGMQESYLKRAMAGREPTRVGNVTIGPDGTVVRDVGADRMKQAEVQFRLGQNYAQTADREERRADRDYQIGLDQDERDYQRGRNIVADANAAETRRIQSQLGFGATSSGGFTPSGEAVRLTKDSRPFTINNGVPTLYSGEIKYPTGAKEPTEDQNKAASWYAQASIGYADMQRAMKEDPNVMYKSGQEAITSAIPLVGEAITNLGMTPMRQVYTGGVAMVTEAFLRGATGAGITKPETLEKIKATAPAYGDSPERIAQKNAAIPKLIQTLQQRAGRALTQEQREKIWEEELDNFDKGLSPPDGVPADVWNGMTQAEKDEFIAAGAVTQ
jgi:hypothetical protein